jgi:hypothetical protein
MDKYTQLKNKVVWAVTHYGLVNTDGIINVLRETVEGLECKKCKEYYASVGYEYCSNC